MQCLQKILDVKNDSCFSTNICSSVSTNCLSNRIVSVLVSSDVDRGFQPWLGQIYIIKYKLFLPMQISNLCNNMNKAYIITYHY